MKHIASRLSACTPFGLDGRVAGRQGTHGKGVDVVDLSLGEPDFPTPRPYCRCRLRGGETRRNAIHGASRNARLREAIARKFAHENGLTFGLNQIAVANGGKQIIFNALMATIDEGDEVILSAPYFVSYPEMVRLVGGVPVSVPCPAETGFLLTPETLEAAITPRTKWLFLNSPNNPSGAVYSADELAALGVVLERHPQVLILSDEIYEHILFDAAGSPRSARPARG